MRTNCHFPYRKPYRDGLLLMLSFVRPFLLLLVNSYFPILRVCLAYKIERRNAYGTHPQPLCPDSSVPP